MLWWLYNTKGPFRVAISRVSLSTRSLRVPHSILSTSRNVRAMSTPAATASSQNVTIPSILELYDPNFLNVLLPVANTNPEKKVVEGSTQPSNPMIEALKKVSHRTRTENNSPAYGSTSDAVLDAFHSLRPYATGKEIWRHLDKAWEQNPETTLRVIWNLRSIHDGKSAREEFYHAWGWLYKNHPRTAIMNLPLLVKPVCTIKKNKNLAPHGYWKDLLNLLCLAALDQLKPTDSQFHYLHCGKMPPASEDDTFFSKIRRRFANPISHRKASKVSQKSVEQLKAEAKEERAKVNVRLHENLLRKLAEPQFRALYIMVARLFAERLSEDVHILLKAESLPEGDERRDLMRSISLAGKWAPSPGLSHDRHTNIASAISQLLHHSYYPGPSKVTVDPSQPLLPAETHILRSYYQRWVLTELRRAILVPEPLMSANRWKEIRYNRVASVCMKNNTENFYKHDPEGFEKYMLDVESGKRTISGATLLPHELVVDAMICYQDMEHQINPKRPSTADVRKRLAEMKIRVVEGQWKSMLDRVKEAGKLDNALAVCDVSGSMGILSGVTRKCASQPIAPAIGLSLVLAQVAQPPFQNKFITFSANPNLSTSTQNNRFSSKSTPWKKPPGA
ncbi:hypothetical protein K474DRAFT_1752430 [Panus rudis PR-1116 ss-1]|nr:hypothetical protein K474DRAFT_1752430 [Panus rudis PR-1116 ss-1]